MIDLIARRSIFFAFSALIISIGLVSAILPGGMRLGIDFTGGTLWELAFEGPVQTQSVRSVFIERGLDATVQKTGEGTVLIRTREIESESPLKGELETALREEVGAFDAGQVRFETVGPAVGTEIAQRAAVAVALASIGILIYIWLVFRRLPNSFRYGACAIAALVHDALILLGAFSIIGRIIPVEIDAMFVTATLTVIGYSVNDTIVVFDRVRENSIKYTRQPLESIVNHSILQSLGRSLNTSLTVVFIVAALVLFGGATTRLFALALLIGVVSGSYSSICIACQLLVVWEDNRLGRVFRRPRPASSAG